MRSAGLSRYAQSTRAMSLVRNWVAWQLPNTVLSAAAGKLVLQYTGGLILISLMHTARLYPSCEFEARRDPLWLHLLPPL